MAVVKKTKLKEKILKKYVHVLTKNPWIMLSLVIVLLVIATSYASQIKNESMNYRSVLPEDIPVIEANFAFEDEFGGTDSAKFVIQINPSYSNSNEIRDVRDPDVFIYASQLQQYISSSDQVISVSSPVDILKTLNKGVLPKNKNKIISLMQQNSLLDTYISSDASMMIINLRLSEDYIEEDVVYDMEDAIRSIKKPAGIKVNVAGDSISGMYVNQQLSADMSKTSLMSILAIILVLILIFGSIKYGLLPLATIIVGLIWTMGFIGLIKMNMTSATSGVLSMIMGIGIDFGIQLITRFRQELKKNKNNIEKSMFNSLNMVVYPMFTTTLAAIIGFQSMSLGQLSIMKDMGTIMTYGVIFCFFAALTVVPALTIFIEKLSRDFFHKHKNKIKKVRGIIKMNKIINLTGIFLIFVISLIMIPHVNAVDDEAKLTVTLLNQDPDPAEAGDYLELRWKIEKIGIESLKDIIFKINPKYPFSIAESDTLEKKIPAWAGQSEEDTYYILYYKLKVDDMAIEDTYDMDLQYTHDKMGNSWLTQTYDVRVGKNEEPNLVIGSINTDPIKLVSDTNDNEVNLELLNIGDADAENILIDLDLPKGFESSYSYSTQDNLGNIEAHQSQIAHLYLDIDENVSAGSYSTKLKIKYKKEDEDNHISIDLPLNIEVKSKPRFEISSIQYNTNSIRAGDEVEMKVKLKNIANEKVESVSVRAFKDSSQPLEFTEKSDYVGTLNVNETGEAIIKFDIDDAASAKKQILDLEIRSVYNDKVFIQNEESIFFIENGKKNLKKTDFVIAGLILVVVILALSLIRSKKLRHKN